MPDLQIKELLFVWPSFKGRRLLSEMHLYIYLWMISFRYLVTRTQELRPECARVACHNMWTSQLIMWMWVWIVTDIKRLWERYSWITRLPSLWYRKILDLVAKSHVFHSQTFAVREIAGYRGHFFMLLTCNIITLMWMSVGKSVCSVFQEILVLL